MAILKLSEDEQRRYSELPESRMGVHFVEYRRPDRFAMVLGCQVLLVLDGGFDNDIGGLLERPWYSPDTPYDEGLKAFFDWHNGLSQAPPVNPIPRSMSLIIVSGPGGGPMPPFPVAPYGHLPFHAMTVSNEKYCRWEPWPRSRRIDLATGAIAPGTFAAPELEKSFMPSGFSAVARLALPSLLPATTLYELSPNPTPVRCGASVPMYGQSGGGVEVEFSLGAKNSGKIPSPTFLPIM